MRYALIGRNRAPSSAENSGSQDRNSGGVAGAEADLFRLIRLRYRETELFRKARPLKAPHDPIDQRLKR
jgi:hypothetical protein